MKTINKLFKYVVLVALIGLISVQTHAQTVTSTYYHTDALGSIVAASDEQGDIIWEKTYDPYGNEVISTENGDEFEGQAYTGKPYDEETGLVYLGQRYYDPEIKRFMGMDPVGFKASNPASFNRYAYANNNPYRFVDPDGREGQDVRQNILTRSFGAGQISRQEFQELSEVPPEVGVIAVGGLGVLAARSAYLAYLANAYRVNQAGIVAAEVAADVTIASGVVRVAAKGPKLGGGATLDKLSPSEIKRIQNAADRSGTDITVVGSRVNPNKALHSKSDFDFVVDANSKTRNNLSRSLPGSKNISEGIPGNQDIFKGAVDKTKPHATFKPGGG